MLPDTLILQSTADGPSINIERKHTHHSPDGFAWGYAGSGPADLALNILALALPHTAPHSNLKELQQALQDETGEIPVEREEQYWQELQRLPVQLFDGSFVSQQAYRLHQAFKQDFLTHLPEAGGEITRADIEQWLAHHKETAS